MAELRARTQRQSETPLSTDEIAQLPDEELDTRVWLRLTHFVDCHNPGSLRAEDRDVAAYLATRVFEWEVGNGGLHQYFFNFPDPDHVGVVLDGYSRLGLDEARRTVEEVIAPIASEEARWREALRDGSIETFFESYVESRLPEYDDRIGFHDTERLSLVRAKPSTFAR